MHPLTQAAFADELTKISNYRTLVRAAPFVGRALKEGGRLARSAGNRAKNFFKRQFHEGWVGGPRLEKNELSFKDALQNMREPGKALSNEWKLSGGLGKAMTAGMAGMSAHAAYQAKGHERSEAIGEGLGSGLGFLALSRVPFIPQAVGAIGLGYLGGKAGGGLGRLAGQKPEQVDE